MSLYQIMADMWSTAEWAVLKGAKQDAFEMNQLLMQVRCERQNYVNYMPGQHYPLRSI